MHAKKLLLFTSLLFVGFSLVRAQDKVNNTFGKISKSDFSLTTDAFDSGASVIILADVGSTKFEGNSKGFFTLIFTRFIRVKVNKKNGFKIGDREIELYHNGGDIEKVYSLKASTYNLENGVINETKLDDKSILNEKYNANYDIRKFSMPALKEGSIFEIEYTVKSPFDSRLMPWSFQSEYPCLWSEYIVTIPPPLTYVMRQQGDQQFFKDESKEVSVNYNIRVDNYAKTDDHYSVDGNSLYRRWVKINVPSLREEEYTTTIDNYYSKVSFQLSYIQWEKGGEKHQVASNWNLMSKELMEDERFGLSLTKDNGWMSDDLKNILQGATNDEQKIQRIYTYIRDQIQTTGKTGIYTHSSLKDVFLKKEGSVSEINLLLTAMIRKAGFEADPMILSTRSNGFADPTYPLISEYNYVVCSVYLKDDVITLDASKSMGFGKLPSSCYNGYGHIINAVQSMPVFFSPDSLHESRLTNVIIINDDKNMLTGALKTTYGDYESNDLRYEISKSSLKEYEKKIATNVSDINIENFQVDSLKKCDFPITVHFDFEVKNQKSADLIYFNPMLADNFLTNPFVSADRHYPVEMPYLIDRTYLFSMEVPTGYSIDELPKSARIAYNENEGMFEYLIQASGNTIQMRVRLVLNKTFFPVDEYGTLRDFFTNVIKKEAEQIVFKKAAK